MAVLEFKQIPLSDKDIFKTRFQEYLDELDLLVGEPIEPDFKKRYPEYDAFFLNNPKKTPFRIYYISDPDNKEMVNIPIGFFFLNIITPQDFPKEISSIYPYDDVLIASLSDFYIQPNFRKKGVAWLFYDAIIKLCTESVNQWHVCFESDIRNKNAIAFYDKVLERIKEDYKFDASKMKYRKKDRKNLPYYFYQIKFEFQ